MVLEELVEQVGRTKGDTVSDSISRTDKNDEAQNGVGSGYIGQFLNIDVLESIIKITLKSFPFMRTSLRCKYLLQRNSRQDALPYGMYCHSRTCRKNSRHKHKETSNAEGEMQYCC